MKYLVHKSIKAASDDKGALASFEIGSFYHLTRIDCKEIAPGVYTVIANLELVEKASDEATESNSG